MATIFTELARKARASLLGQTLDVAPASFELEVHAVTSENYPVFLRAAYTVGARTYTAAAVDNTPLLLHAEPRHVSKAAGACPRRVKELIRRHVSALAGGTTTQQMVAVTPTVCFLNEAVDRVNLDLAGGGGLFVYSAAVERLAILAPSDKVVSVEIVAEDHGTSPAAFKMQVGAKKQVLLAMNNVAVNAGDGNKAAAVSVAVIDDPATKRADWDKQQIKVAGVGAELIKVDLDGKSTLRLKLTADQLSRIKQERESSAAALLEQEKKAADAKRALEQELDFAKNVVAEMQELADSIRTDKNRGKGDIKRLKSHTKSIRSLKLCIHECEARRPNCKNGEGVRGRDAH